MSAGSLRDEINAAALTAVTSPKAEHASHIESYESSSTLPRHRCARDGTVIKSQQCFRGLLISSSLIIGGIEGSMPFLEYFEEAI
jgi:hypothetical protein